MARIFWDSNLFIYLFEKNQEWAPRVVEFRREMRRRGDQLVTSWLTVGEVVTKPMQMGDRVLERSYLNFFEGGAVELVAFDAAAALLYADLRSRTRVRPADGIQLACAGAARSDLFVTNDYRLSGLVVPGVTFLTTLAKIPY